MGVQGAMTFGRLINTFLPGSVLFLSIIFIVDTAFAIRTENGSILASMKENQAFTAFVSIPASLILGLVLNAIWFRFLYKPFVRKPFETKNRPMVELEEELRNTLIAELTPSTSLPKHWKEYFNSFYFMLPRISIDHIMYLREQTWYYAEFHANFLLSLCILIPTATFWAMVRDTDLSPLSVVTYLLTVLVVYGVIAVPTIRTNYRLYRVGKINLLMGLLIGNRIETNH